jgi:N6-adenosine-specific RNA methylase IME4
VNPLARYLPPIPRVAGGFSCIFADPAWAFHDKGSRIAPDQRSKRADGKGYDTMTVGEICGLGLAVKAAAAPDCLLALCTTSVHLLDGSAALVCREWGFDPPEVTAEWIKLARARFSGELRKALRQAFREGVEDVYKAAGAFEMWAIRDLFPRLQIGMGHITRGAHEHVILAKRGRPKILDRGVPSVVFAPRGRHSEKPDALLEMTERLVAGPRLELFARRRRPGWIGWGLEYPQLLLAERAGVDGSVLSA